MEPGFVAADDNSQPFMLNLLDKENNILPSESFPDTDKPGYAYQKQEAMEKEEYLRQLDELKAKHSSKDDIDGESNMHDGGTSCLATCTTSDIEDDLLKSSFSYEGEDGGDNRPGFLTSCVGTRWFRAPELLYGSVNYGLEVDLWSLGCIFAELLTLDPLFPGTSDIDQLSRIFSVLGNLTEEVWAGCTNLPDYRTISFAKVENPTGLEACLRDCSPDEVSLVKKLVCYHPAARATAMELINEKYFNQEPFPVPISELWVPESRSGQDEDFPGEWDDYNGMGSDSDFDDFGPVNFRRTSAGFSMQFL